MTGREPSGVGPARASVSIVVPVHDGERYLTEALRSCVDQDYRPLEILVVDDASKDSSREIAEGFAREDSRVRVLALDANVKLPAALNAGFGASSGQYLTWTSDDNLYRPGAITRMAQVLTQDPSVDVVYAGSSHIDEEGKTVGHWDPGPATEIPFRNPVGACFLYRRMVHEALGGYAEDLFTVEDFDFWVRASCHFEFLPLHEDLYLYRRHAASLSSTRASERDALAEKALLRALPSMPRALRARAHLQLCAMMERRGDDASARSHLRAGLLRAPLSGLRHLARGIRARWAAR